MLHCHAPDEETSIEESATALDEAFKEGKFKKVHLHPSPSYLFHSYSRNLTRSSPPKKKPTGPRKPQSPKSRNG